jgi:hypothetical protein
LSSVVPAGSGIGRHLIGVGKEHGTIEAGSYHPGGETIGEIVACGDKDLRR